MTKPLLIPALLLVAIAVAVYAKTLGFHYTQIDDPKHIFENSSIKSPTLSSIKAIWSHPYFGLYIPATYSVWTIGGLLSRSTDLENRRTEPAPFIFHFFNLALHSINSLLVLLLIYWILQQTPSISALASSKRSAAIAAFWGALFFAAHPLQNQAVGWISGLKDLLATFFFLLAAHLHLRSCTSTTPKGKLSGVLGVAMYLLAILSKPNTVVAPAILFVLQRYLLRHPWKKIAPLVTWFAIGVPWIWVTKRLQPAHELFTIPSIPERLLVFCDSILFYLRKTLFPTALVFDYGRTPANLLDSSWAWISPLLFILMSGYAIYLLKRKGHWLLPLWTMLVFSLAPTSGLIPFNFQIFSTVANHYVYFGFWILGLAASLYLIEERDSRRQGALCAFTGLMVFCSFSNIGFWRDSESMFLRNLKYNPQSFLAHNNLGIEYILTGRPQKAIPHMVATIHLRPNEPEHYNNLGSALLRSGQTDKALQVLEKALQLNPNSATSHFNLGSAFLAIGDKNRALSHLELANSLSPNSPKILELMERAKQAQAGNPKAHS